MANNSLKAFPVRQGHNSEQDPNADLKRVLEQKISKVLRPDVTLADAANLIIQSNMDAADRIVNNDKTLQEQSQVSADYRHTEFKQETRHIVEKVEKAIKRTTNMGIVAIIINLLTLFTLVTIIIVLLKVAIIIRT